MSQTIDSEIGLLSYQNFVHAFSGTVAGAFAISLLFPFETVRTRLQVDDGRRTKSTIRVILDIVEQEGFWSLYRGWWSLVVSFSATNFVYFYIFHGLKLYIGPTSAFQSVHMDLIFGLVAGVVAVLFTNPLWVVNTRLKLRGVRLDIPIFTDGHNKTFTGIFGGLVEIAMYDGVFALWGGLTSSLILVTNPAINYVVYEALKRNIFYVFERWFSVSSIYFIFGALSKLVATVVTYPIQVIQTRARAGIAIPALFQSQRQNLFWQRIAFFYRGMESKLIQTILTSALMLATYEYIKQTIFYLLDSSDS